MLRTSVQQVVNPLVQGQHPKTKVLTSSTYGPGLCFMFTAQHHVTQSPADVPLLYPCSLGAEALLSGSHWPSLVEFYQGYQQGFKCG